MDTSLPGSKQKTADQLPLANILFSETFLRTLVAEVETDQMQGIMLGGSYARGDATPYSDIDLVCFVPYPFRPQSKQFLYREGRLVSLEWQTLEEIQQQLTNPSQALWVVPSFRHARILLDKDGSMHRLKQLVEAFVWNPLRTRAIEEAGHILTEDIEYVHKLLSTLWKGNLPGTIYTTHRLLDDATMVVALFLPVFMTNESLYYQEVEAVVGSDTAWTQYHRLLTGTSTFDKDDSSVEARGKLALRLYRETSHVLWPVLDEPRRSLIEQVLHLIEQAC